jgi:uncharacterized lipoprotein
MRLPVKAAQTNFLRVAHLIALVVCVVLLTSCSLFRHKDKQPVYYSAVEAKPLEIPPGLDRPTSTSALVIVTPMAPLPQTEMKIVPPRISSQSAGGKDSWRIHWSNEGAYLLVKDKKESVYRRLGLAIQRAGMSMSDTSLEDSYRFEYRHDPKDPDRGFFSKLAFWRDDGPNYSGGYLAVLQADGENTRVIIKNADGSEADQAAAEHLLNIFGERLG